MQPDEQDAGYLWDILDAARNVTAYTAGLSSEQYMQDRKTIRAVERELEIIGEAARRLSDSFKAAHPEVPWRRIVSLRNVLAHEYGEVQQDIIWRIAQARIPELIAAIDPLVPPREPPA